MSYSDRSGSVFANRYRLDGLLGRGATAEVYRAVDLTTGGPVAVKIITAEVGGSAEAKARFEREAAVQAMVRHRNVAALLASGWSEQREPFLVMELLRGTSLRSVAKSGQPISEFFAASYMWQALQGLAAVHAKGVLHRDLKPANIMLEPSPGPIDRVVLIDFGFAALEGGAALTQRGVVVGSLTYMAPERLSAGDVGEASDLYAIGAILFELVTGQPPFVAEREIDLIDLQRHAAPPPTLVGGRRSLLDPIVQQALQKAPANRFGSAKAMATALGNIAASLAPQS